MITFKTLSSRPTLVLLYVGQFIFSFHSSFLVYINSSFLETIYKKTEVSALYIGSSILSILVLIYFPTIFRRVGIYGALLFFTTLEIASLIAIFLLDISFLLVPFLLIFLGMYAIIATLMDIFLEREMADERNTGLMRSTFLTMANIAVLIAPLGVGILVAGDHYRNAYLFSALFLIPFLFIVSLTFRRLDHRTFNPPALLQTLRCLTKNRDMVSIFAVQFLLQFFYAWMVVYTPIYLHEAMHFSWPVIGIIFTVMLLPFVIFELPAGRIADKILGEKELLIGGFVIMGLFTIALSFIDSNSLFLWALLLFMTRVGASLIETMSDVYFFKHVTIKDTNSVGLFRMLGPLSFIVGPLVGIIALSLVPFQYLFLLLGIIVFLGIPFAFALRDTR